MINVGDIYTFKSDDAPASLGKFYHGAGCKVLRIKPSKGRYSYYCGISGKKGLIGRWISLDALYYYTNCPNPDMTLPKIIMTHRLVEYCVD